MSDPSQTSDQKTSQDSLSVTSSLAWEDGATHSDSQDGQTIDLFGQVVAPVNLSARRGKALSPTIRATFGLPFSSSSRSADLQSCVESRLREQMDGRGSILFSLTWRAQTTASGRRICALLASGRRTSDSDYTGWATTTTRDHKDTGDLDKSQFRRDGQERNDTIARQAQVGCPTTRVQMSRQTADREDKHSNLEEVVTLTSRPTPTTQEDGRTLEQYEQGRLRGYETRKGKTSGGPGSKQGSLSISTQLISGPTSPGSPAATANPGQLNSAFSLWLMGYPIAWAHCAAQVTRSSRSARKPSSERTLQQQLEEAEAELAALKSQLHD